MYKYEIRYKHYDMQPEYVGKTTKWAIDEKKAISFLCSGKPSKDGHCTTKKGARIKILSTECISQQIKSKSSGKDTTQESAPFSLSH